MDGKSESKLIQTLNKHQEEDLSLKDRLVLVQNQLGIFFGTLKKADSRKGTALLVNGYAISPDKHITYAQYERLCSLDNASTIPGIDRIKRSEGSGVALSVDSEIGYSVQEHAMIYEQASRNTITDFALEGIATYRTVSDLRQLNSEAAKFYPDRTSVPLLSLSGVIAMVEIGEGANIMMYDGENEISIPVIDTFNGSIFGTVDRSVSENNDSTPEHVYNAVSYFGEVTEPLIAYKGGV